jgi:phosphate starvation-inducible PhoH-like protein
VLGGLKGVAFVELTREDIVRHPLVQEIVDAYGEDDLRPAPGEESSPAGEEG